MEHLLSILFWAIPIAALVLYSVLLLVFAVSRKTRQIKAFIFFLIAMFFWVASSLLMKLDISPGFQFWNNVLIASMLTVPCTLYYFVIRFLELRTPRVSILVYLGTVVIVLLTFMGAFVTNKLLIVDASSHSATISYRITPLVILPVLFIAGVILLIALNLYRSVRSGTVSSATVRPIILGVILMFIGCLANILPGLGRYPIDILACVINAILLMMSIFNKRLFTLKFILTRGLMYAVFSAISIVLLLLFGPKIYSFVSSMFPTTLTDLSITVVSIVYALYLAGTFIITRKIIDKVFINSDYNRRQALSAFSKNIANDLNLSRILDELASTVRNSLGASEVYILLYNSENIGFFTAKSTALTPTDPHSAASLHFADNNPIVQWLKNNQRVLSKREILSLHSFRSLWDSERSMLRNYDVELLVPISSRDSLVGIIALAQNENGKEYTAEDSDVLLQLGSSTSIAIDNARLYEKAKKQAQTDELTGLLNRRSFYEDINTYVLEARRTNTPMALLQFDMDMFRLYNDMFGSLEGDRALRHVGVLIREMVGKSGKVYRYSGAEFAVIMPMTDGVHAYSMAEAIRARVEDVFSKHEDTTRRFLTISGGACVYPMTASNVNELSERAGVAMFTAKKEGKNRVVLYSPKTASAAQSNTPSVATTAYALAAAIDAKDHFTFSHSQHVAEYAAALAAEMGADEEHVHIIREAGLLHDVGKIGVPESILTKPGRLDNDEYNKMKEHVTMSIEIIKHMPTLNYVIPAVLGHHERYDGKGYPRGISGTDIPFAARCLNVVDSFDAMVSERPYKTTLPVEYALNELVAQAGRQFDPELALKFVELVRSGKIKVFR